MENKEKNKEKIAWERLLGKPQDNQDLGGFDEPEIFDEVEICERA